jgi:hypothetical protein
VIGVLLKLSLSTNGYNFSIVFSCYASSEQLIWLSHPGEMQFSPPPTHLAIVLAFVLMFWCDAYCLNIWSYDR